VRVKLVFSKIRVHYLATDLRLGVKSGLHFFVRSLFAGTAGLFALYDRGDDRYSQYGDDHHERDMNGDRIVVIDQHLHPDKGEDKGNPRFQIDEHLQDIGYEIVKAPQAHYGKNVGGIDDEGVPGDRKDGWDGVHGENHVARLHHQKRQEERSDREPPLFLAEKPVTV